MTSKALVIEAINRMPKNATLDEIAEDIAILAAIDQGRKEIAAGKLITDEALGRLIDSWHSNSSPARPRKKSSRKSTTASRRRIRPRPRS